MVCQLNNIHMQNIRLLLRPFSVAAIPLLCRTCPNLILTLIFLQTTALKSIKSLAPLLDRILVQRIKAETKTASGIFLPESAVKELNEARVLAVGPGGLDKDGKRVAPSVAPGDKVLIPQVSRYLWCLLVVCASRIAGFAVQSTYRSTGVERMCEYSYMNLY